MLSSIDDEKLARASRFLARFLALGLVFRLVSTVFPTFLPLQELYAYLTATSLEIAGFPAARNGVEILLGDWFRITRDCTGWKSVSALLGLSVASKSYEARKIGLGIAIILLLNLARIVTVILLHYTGIASFSVTHGILWRWGLTLAVLSYWVAFMDKKV